MASDDKPIRNKTWLESFGHALAGLWFFVRRERNAKFELTFATLGIIIGLSIHLSALRWILFTGVCLVVLTVECINTAIELTVDQIPGARANARAGTAKDVAAGAVVLVAGMAIVAGVWIFGPGVLKLLGGF